MNAECKALTKTWSKVDMDRFMHCWNSYRGRQQNGSARFEFL